MIPQDANKVRFTKRNKLFIEIDDFVIELDNPYDYEPEFVYLTKLSNGEYVIKGFEPKPKTETKKSTKTFIVEE